jgi:hypothetical protein
MVRWLLLSGYALLVAFASWCVLPVRAGEEPARPAPVAVAPASGRLLRQLSGDLHAGDVDGCLRRLARACRLPAAAGTPGHDRCEARAT